MTPQICQQWLRHSFPSEVWGEAESQRWKELTVTCMHIIWDTFILTLIFTLTVFLTFLHTRTHFCIRHAAHHTCTQYRLQLEEVLMDKTSGVGWQGEKMRESCTEEKKRSRKKEAESGRERKRKEADWKYSSSGKERDADGERKTEERLKTKMCGRFLRSETWGKPAVPNLILSL